MGFINVKDSSGSWVNIPVLKGDTGATPNITVKATTLAVGAAATVTRTGTNENPVLTFGLPASDVNSVLTNYAKLTGATFTGPVKATTFQATSDQRLKNNVEEYNPSLDGIQSYRYDLQNDAYDGKRIGVLAQEVIDKVPEAVKQEDNGMYSVDYQALVALCISEINALKKRIKQLEQSL